MFGIFKLTNGIEILEKIDEKRTMKLVCTADSLQEAKDIIQDLSDKKGKELYQETIDTLKNEGRMDEIPKLQEQLRKGEVILGKDHFVIIDCEIFTVNYIPKIL